MLGFEGCQDVVGVIFNHIVIDMAALGTTLGTRLNIDVRHDLLRRVFDERITSTR
jgi:hypothetical protein